MTSDKISLHSGTPPVSCCAGSCSPRPCILGSDIRQLSGKVELRILQKLQSFTRLTGDTGRAVEVVITWAAINGFFPYFSLKDNCLLMQK